MKLILKTLKQQPHEVEVDSDEITIKDLKVACEKKHNIAADTIKLVFNGTILKDESTIKSYNITDGNILVMMISKTKVVNKPPVEEVPKTTTTTNVNTTVTTNTNNNPQPNIANNTNLNTTTNNSGTNNNQTNTNQVDYTNEINTLVEMGFPKDYSETCIKAAQGNVTVAIEFLYNGIPEGVQQRQNQSQNVNQGQGQGQSQSQEQNNQGNEEESSLTAVRRIASIIKVLCANDPSQLQNIILSLQQTRPELLELIKQHEAEFKQILQSPVSEQDISAFQQFNSELGLEGGQGGQGGQGQGQGGRQPVLRLSKEEYDAIQRLKEFGFSEMEAAQAYMACDKNEELALNFLFEAKAQESGFNGKFIIFYI